MQVLMTVVVLVLSSAAFAKDVNYAPSETKQKSAFEQALESHTDLRTQERWVQIGGTRYREVEYRGKKYYIKFVARETDFAELDCDIPTNAGNPHEIGAGVTVFHRSQLFVDFLQETCEKTAQGQVRRSFRLDPRLGFTIPDSEKSVIKNKKVYLTPTGPGFSGDW